MLVWCYEMLNLISLACLALLVSGKVLVRGNDIKEHKYLHTWEQDQGWEWVKTKGNTNLSRYNTVMTHMYSTFLIHLFSFAYFVLIKESNQRTSSGRRLDNVDWTTIDAWSKVEARKNMRKESQVRTRNSIKWSTPDMEQHGEKNWFEI